MNDNHNGRPIEILLVEDNLGDVRLTQEALKETKVHNRLSVVNNGEDAMASCGMKDVSGPRHGLILFCWT